VKVVSRRCGRRKPPTGLDGMRVAVTDGHVEAIGVSY